MTMLAVRTCSQTPHLVSIHCLFRVMKSRLRKFGLFATRGCFFKKQCNPVLAWTVKGKLLEHLFLTNFPKIKKQIPISYIHFKAIGIKQIIIQSIFAHCHTWDSYNRPEGAGTATPAPSLRSIPLSTFPIDFLMNNLCQSLYEIQAQLHISFKNL